MAPQTGGPLPRDCEDAECHSVGLRIEERKPVPPHASPTDPFSTRMPNMDGPARPTKE